MITAKEAGQITRQYLAKKREEEELRVEKELHEARRREALNVNYGKDIALLEEYLDDDSVQVLLLKGKGVSLYTEICPNAEEYAKKHGYRIQYKEVGDFFKSMYKEKGMLFNSLLYLE